VSSERTERVQAQSKREAERVTVNFSSEGAENTLSRLSARHNKREREKSLERAQSERKKCKRRSGRQGSPP